MGIHNERSCTDLKQQLEEQSGRETERETYTHTLTYTQWILLCCLALSVPCGYCVCVCVCTRAHRPKCIIDANPLGRDDADQSLWCGNIVATPTSNNRTKGERVATYVPLFLLNSRPLCLLQPVCSPPPYPPSLPLMLLSSTSSDRSWDCVTSTQFQINRLQRVMKARGGYERWGGGKRGDLSFHDNCRGQRTACGTHWRVCVHI